MKRYVLIPAWLICWLIAPPVVAEIDEKPRPAVRWSTVERTYPVDESNIERITVSNIVMENEHLRMEVCPELGGRVMSVRYLQGKLDLFNRYDRLKARYTWDAGGWRPSFPFYEHGMRFVDQPAGWRMLRLKDGSLVLGLDMRFSRFRDNRELNYKGRFSHLRLGRAITLRPGQAFFECRMIVENPLPYRVGYRLWSTAQFPWHKDARFIFPVTRMMYHRAERPSDWPGERGWDQYRNWPLKHSQSFFAVGMKHPFAAIYYPDDDVNHIRITDPSKAPGAKLYGWAKDARYKPFFEIWSGSDAIFEEAGQFIEPFARRGFTEKAYIAKGIGPVAYANEHVAVGFAYTRDEDGVVYAEARITPSRAIRKLRIALDGERVNHSTVRTLKPFEVQPLWIKVDKRGTPVTLRADDDGKEILNITLPLEVPKPDAALESKIRSNIYPPKDASAKVDVEHAERRGWVNYILSGNGPTIQTQGVWNARKWLKNEPKSAEAHAAMGRLMYRMGDEKAAAEHLEKSLSIDPKNAQVQALLVFVSNKANRTTMREATRMLSFYGAQPSIMPLALKLTDPKLSDGVKAEVVQSLEALQAEDPASIEIEELLRRAKGITEDRSSLGRLLKDNPEAGEALQRFRALIDKGEWRHPPRPDPKDYAPIRGRVLYRSLIDTWPKGGKGDGNE